MKEMKSFLQFKKYIIEKIEFDYNLNFSEDETKLDFSIDKEFITLDEDAFVLRLIMEVFPPKEGKEYPFNLKVVMAGFFKCKEQIDIEKYLPNAAAIMYPYMRSILTSITSNANVAPLILPTINTQKLFIDE